MQANVTPAVVVKKPGFLATLASGFFGLLITVVVCAAGLGGYALHVVDSKLDSILDVGGTALEHVENWREVLPPLVTDAFDDRDGAHYDEHIEVDVELVGGGRHGERVVFRVRNAGDESVSWLAFNVVVKDEGGIPIDDFRVYAATPLSLDADDWRGPLRRGSTREFAHWFYHHTRDDAASVAIEVTELRLQNTARTAVAINN